MIHKTMMKQIKSATRKFHSQTCLIEEQSASTVGELGEQLHSVWNVVQDNVPCRIITIGRQSGSAGQMVGEQESLVDSYRLSVPAGTPLGVDMRVTIDGLTYHVVNILTARTDENERQAIIKRIVD